MPPLLAALLMLEMGCDLRIIQAIDLSMEWRRLSGFGLVSEDLTFNYPINWYSGALGIEFLPKLTNCGSYVWPVSFQTTMTLLASPRFYRIQLNERSK